MRHPRVYVDFNEMIEPDIVLLSKTDTKMDSEGNMILFQEGKKVSVYTDDIVYSDDPDDEGKVDNLIADGVAMLNTRNDRTSVAKWVLKIDAYGIRHESEEHDIIEGNAVLGENIDAR